jgi:long-chain acyl-CoA synthetase
MPPLCEEAPVLKKRGGTIKMGTNLSTILRGQARKYGERLAVEKRLNGEWQGISWREYYESARAVGLGLYGLGVRKGDRVSLLAQNRLEWVESDMGIIGIGAVTIPIYTTLPAHEVGYIISNSESKVYIAEDKVAFQKALDVRDECPSLEKIVVIDTDGCDMSADIVMSYEDLKGLGRDLLRREPGLFDRLTDEIEPEDLATIVYTSGTTGPPKGAMISHSNVLAVIDALDEMKWADDKDVLVAFLPLSHVFQRVAGHFFAMYVGIYSHYTESFDTVVEDIQSKKPTILLAVPRVCEKVYAKILGQAKEQPQWKQSVFNWAVGVGADVSKLMERKKPIPTILNLKYKVAYKMVFEKLRQALGGRTRWMVASGAPLARDIADFFNAAGIFLIEGYGMTECSAPATLNKLDNYKFGTAGTPLSCNEVRIADDGEVLIKGGNIIRGYWKMPEETKNAFTDNGWLMSGDIGTIDQDGFLTITDRKKDLIITAGGKNIAPQNIEGHFKQNPLFEQFVVIGDAKKYLVALVNINLDEAARLAREANLTFATPEELLEREDFKAIVDKFVEERNSHLAQYETIKYYHIAKHVFSEETGELTPSLKVKRKVVMEKHKDIVESMYPAE